MSHIIAKICEKYTISIKTNDCINTFYHNTTYDIILTDFEIALLIVEHYFTFNNFLGREIYSAIGQEENFFLL